MGYANILPTAESDGVLYCSAVAVPSVEASLGDGLVTPDPIAVVEGIGISAVVELSITGSPGSNSTYVVMQSDYGDGKWADIAWCVWAGTSGSANFVLSGGGLGVNNSFQQSRAVGAAPSMSGSNACSLGGRVRFVGQSTTTGTVKASILYRFTMPR